MYKKGNYVELAEKTKGNFLEIKEKYFTKNPE
jgi:hypothetical protein